MDVFRAMLSITYVMSCVHFMIIQDYSDVEDSSAAAAAGDDDDNDDDDGNELGERDLFY